MTIGEKIMKFWRERRPALLGLFFYVVLGITFYKTAFEAKTREFPERHYLPVKLKSAENLKVNASVYVNGVYSGRVDSLYFFTLDKEGRPIPSSVDVRDLGSDETSGQFVMAVLLLTKKPDLYPGYKIFTLYQTILSEKSVEIRTGDLPSQETEKSEAEEGGGLMGLFDDPETPLEDLLAGTDTRDLSEFTEDENGIFRKNPEYLLPEELLILRSTGVLPSRIVHTRLVSADNYDDPLFQVASVIQENRPGIRRITRNLAEVTHKINYGKGNLALLLNTDDLSGAGHNLMKHGGILVEEFRSGYESYRETEDFIDFLGGWLVTALFRIAEGSL